MEIACLVNGHERTLRYPPTTATCTVLRDLQLYSVRETCGVGVCGTCTVLLDGRPVSTCILPAYALAGRAVVTAEGLADGPAMTQLQRQFIEKQAFQCSFCTPGFLMSSQALLASTTGELTRDEIINGLQGHICRCGCYRAIVDAVQAAAQLQGDDPGETLT